MRVLLVLATAILVSLVATGSADAGSGPRWYGPTPAGNDGPGSRLSCPDERLCVLGGDSGIWVSHKPLGGKFRRITPRVVEGPAPAPGTRFADWSDLVCPSVSLCLSDTTSKSNFQHDVLLASRGPVAKFKSYRSVGLMKYGLNEITCAGSRLCAATGQSHTMFSSDPGRAGSWRVKGSPDQLQHIGCSLQACLAWDNSGSPLLATIVSPSAKGTRWKLLHFPPDGQGSYSQGACLGLSCLIGDSGTILASSDVRTGKKGWVRTDLRGSEPGQYLVNSPVCLSLPICIATRLRIKASRIVGEDLVYSFAPFSGEATSWHSIPIPPSKTEGADSLNCLESGVCFMTSLRDRGEGKASRTYVRAVRLDFKQLAQTFG